LNRHRAGCLNASEILSFLHVGRPLAVVEILLRFWIFDEMLYVSISVAQSCLQTHKVVGGVPK
jgi:hypothetical protein